MKMPDEIWACPDPNWEPTVDIYATREKLYDDQSRYIRAGSDEYVIIKRSELEGLLLSNAEEGINPEFDRGHNAAIDMILGET